MGSNDDTTQKGTQMETQQQTSFDLDAIHREWKEARKTALRVGEEREVRSEFRWYWESGFFYGLRTVYGDSAAHHIMEQLRERDG